MTTFSPGDRVIFLAPNTTTSKPGRITKIFLEGNPVSKWMAVVKSDAGPTAYTLDVSELTLDTRFWPDDGSASYNWGMHRVTKRLNLPTLIPEIHRENVDAGWWSDPATGLRKERNVAEMLALIHSEISEADEALAFNLMDDKIPHRDGADVEFADVVIRVCDLAGAHGFTLDSGTDGQLARDELDLLSLCSHHAFTSRALEGFRKGNLPVAERNLGLLVRSIAFDAWKRGYDLPATIAEKRHVNRNRADHKLAARLADGGKKF